MKTPIEKAVDICGGQTALANAIGGSVTQSHVWGWINRSGSIAPPEYCYAIERATNGQVTRRDLRPDDWQDIWPELAEKAAA